MIKFGLDDYTTEFHGWTKHHKQLAIHLKREYTDGREPVLPKDEQFVKLLANNEDKLIKKGGALYDRETDERSEVVDFFLPLNNLDYQPAELEHYSVGASNTSQKTFVRIYFLLDYVHVILDYSYTSRGSFAMPFSRLIEDIDDIVYELADDGREFADKGIMFNEDPDDGEYYVVGIDEYKRTIEFGISKRELLDSLIGIEVYKHEMTIDE